jgi:hypothetical protein
VYKTHQSDLRLHSGDIYHQRERAPKWPMLQPVLVLMNRTQSPVGAAEGCDRPGTGRILETAEGRADLISAFGSSYRETIFPPNELLIPQSSFWPTSCMFVAEHRPAATTPGLLV